MNITTTTTSGKGSISNRDALQGLIYAGILPALLVIENSLEAGSLTLDWRKILVAALSGFVAHIIRKFFQPPVIVVTAPKETVDAVKEGDAKVTVKTT